MHAAIVMPMHDPTGLLFPRLTAITPQLKNLFDRAVISITAATRAQQPAWVARYAADDFFNLYELYRKNVLCQPNQPNVN